MKRILNVRTRELIIGKKKVKLTYPRTLILSRLTNNLPIRSEELWDIDITVKKNIAYFRKLGLNIITKINVGYMLLDKIEIDW